MSKIPGPGSRLPQPGSQRKSKSPAYPVVSPTRPQAQDTAQGPDVEYWKRQIGKHVKVANKETGILRYFGRTAFANGYWCGIQLERPEGKNDGSVDNVRYFTCDPNHGLFAPVHIVNVVNDPYSHPYFASKTPSLLQTLQRTAKDASPKPSPNDRYLQSPTKHLAKTALHDSVHKSSKFSMEEYLLLETLRNEEHQKPDLIKSCESYSPANRWSIPSSLSQRGQEKDIACGIDAELDYLQDEEDLETPTLETLPSYQPKLTPAEHSYEREYGKRESRRHKEHPYPLQRNQEIYQRHHHLPTEDGSKWKGSFKPKYRFSLEDDLPEELLEDFSPTSFSKKEKWLVRKDMEEEYEAILQEVCRPDSFEATLVAEDVIEDSEASGIGPSSHIKNPSTSSWAEGSITTSIISMSSLDGGYQGDAEYEPRSEGGTGAANSPIEPDKGFPEEAAAAKITDGHSDSDFCSDAAVCTESDAEVEEMATPITRSHTLVGDVPCLALDQMALTDLNKPATIFHSEMESSGIYSDLDYKDMETQRKLKSKQTLPTLESSGVSPEEPLDIQEQWNDASVEQESATAEAAVDSGPYSIQVNQSETVLDTASSDNTVIDKCSSGNELVETEKEESVAQDDDVASQTTENMEERKYKPKLQKRPRVEVSKPQKVVIKNVESKVKAMMKEAPQREDTRKIVRQPKKPGRWDNVMSQIAQNKADDKKKPRREVRSKVFANMGPIKPMPPRPSSASSSVISEKLSPASSSTPRNSIREPLNSTHSIPGGDESQESRPSTGDRGHVTRVQPPRSKTRALDVETSRLMVVSGRKGGPIEKLKEEVSRLQKEVKGVNDDLQQSERGFMAMTVLMQYMHTELDAFSTPIIRRQLFKLQSELTNLQEQLDSNHTEKSLLQDELILLAKEHEGHVNNMERRHQETVEAHDRRIKELLKQQEEETNQLQEQAKKEMERVRSEKEEELSTFRRQADTQLSDMRLTHADEMREVSARLATSQGEASCLKERTEKLEEECTRYQKEFKKMEETMLKDANVKIQVLAERCRSLQKDAESHKAVLDIKAQELQDSRQQTLELEKQVDELRSYREQALYLKQKCEDLEAQIGHKQDQERSLIQDQEQLSLELRKEAKENKRLSMEVEGLQWKIRHNAKLSDSAGDGSRPSTSRGGNSAQDKKRGSPVPTRSCPPSPLPVRKTSPAIEEDPSKKRLSSASQLPATPEAVNETHASPLRLHHASTRAGSTSPVGSSSEDVSLPPSSPLIKNVYVGRDKALSYVLDLESDDRDRKDRDAEAELDSLGFRDDSEAHLHS